MLATCHYHLRPTWGSRVESFRDRSNFSGDASSETTSKGLEFYRFYLIGGGLHTSFWVLSAFPTIYLLLAADRFQSTAFLSYVRAKF
jgi:hypothetical protein